MSLMREISGGFDPSAGTNSTTIESYTFNGVELTATKADDAYFEPQTLVNGKARIILAEAFEPEPQTGDSITYGGQTVEVVSVSRINPNGIAVIYKIRGVI